MNTRDAKDDVFDDEEDDSMIQEREWQRMKMARSNEGFREGIAAGQDLTLQEGFNKGYTEATERFYHVAHLRGLLSGMMGFYLTFQPNKLPDMTRQKFESAIDILTHMDKPQPSQPTDTVTDSNRPDLGLPDIYSSPPALDLSSKSGRSQDTLAKSPDIENVGSKVEEVEMEKVPDCPSTAPELCGPGPVDSSQHLAVARSSSQSGSVCVNPGPGNVSVAARHSLQGSQDSNLADLESSLLYIIENMKLQSTALSHHIIEDVKMIRHYTSLATPE